MVSISSADENISWNLESFLNSLIYELDRANQTLAIKQDNVKMTYTVQDLSVTLQVFPQYDGDRVRFLTAQPGEEGASTMTFQLGSIRDTQIREIARKPPSRDEVTIDNVEMPDEERKTLKRLGINTTEDLRRTVEEKRVDIEQITDKKVNYRNLAEIINRSRRQGIESPRIRGVSLSVPPNGTGGALLSLHGENLKLEPQNGEMDQGVFPFALLDGSPLSVVSASSGAVHLSVPPDKVPHLSGALTLALDPYAVLTMQLTDHDQSIPSMNMEDSNDDTEE
jgi:hypothetical protein